MTAYSVTVQQAMDKGVRLIERPSMAIVVGSTILCPLAMIYHFDWRELFIIPAGVFLSVLYGSGPYHDGAFGPTEL